jgi:excinuclease ABC subunit B
VTEEVEAMPEGFHAEEDLDAYIAKLETSMREAAQRFEFEKAAKLRDTIRDLRSKDFLFDAPRSATPPPDPSAT